MTGYKLKRKRWKDRENIEGYEVTGIFRESQNSLTARVQELKKLKTNGR